jgi:hypothetical protein
MWALCGVWSKWIKGGVGGLLWHSKLLWNGGEIEKDVCTWCVILMENG